MNKEYKLIKPKKEHFVVKVFDNKDNFLFNVTTLNQMYDVRCQIAEDVKEYGYYFMHNGNKIILDEYGRIERNSRKFIPFTEYEDYLDRLMRV